MKREFLKVSLDTKLSYIDAHVRDAKHGIILVHGLAEHSGRYEEFISKLNNAQISVFAIDLRGHGQSGGRRGDILNFTAFINDLDLFINHIKQKHPKIRLALFGHSIGGLIAIEYAAQSDIVDMLVLSSPSLETPRAIKILNMFPKKLLSKIYIKKRHSESPEMLEYSRNDPYACHKFTLGLLKSVFIGGVKQVSKNYNKITIPVLMLGGRADNLVNSGILESLLNKFSSTDKTFIIYENAKHRIVQNDAKDKSIPDIIKWLKS